jgi:hypothetical protein
VCFELGRSLSLFASFTLGILPLAFPLSLLLLLYIPIIPLDCLPGTFQIRQQYTGFSHRFICVSQLSLSLPSLLSLYIYTILHIYIQDWNRAHYSEARPFGLITLDPFPQPDYLSNLNFKRNSTPLFYPTSSPHHVGDQSHPSFLLHQVLHTSNDQIQ